MNVRRGGGAPAVVRLVAGLIRGEGAEYVRGDLEESWFMSSSRAGRMMWVLDALVTVVAWWNPVARRRRARVVAGGAAGGGTADVGQDFRHAVRGLARRPGFAVLAIVTLGLGIGAPATIYSVVDAIVVRGLPYADADRLVVVGNTFPGREWRDGGELQAVVGVAGPNYRDWRERVRTLSSLQATEIRTLLMPDRGQGPELLPAADVTEGFLALLGAPLALGRSFAADDMRGADRARAVVVSWGVWQRRMGADAAVLGEPFPGMPNTTVIGVLAEGFAPPEAVFGRREVAAWMPLDITSRRYANRGERRLTLMGRLAPGATLRDARQELASVQAEVARENPEGNIYPDGKALGAGANLLQAQTVGATGRKLVLFLASSALLLLIAALNTANLLLVRGLDREREIAVRRTLGASQWGIARVVLIESLVLALAGCVLGLFIAWGGIAAFLRLVPSTMPRLSEVSLNGRILGISVAGSILVGLVAGLLPALRQGARSAMAHRTVSSTEPRSGMRLRLSLVSAQLALAALLGVGATLLFRSFVNVATTDPGFDAAGLVSFNAGLKRPGAAQMAAWESWDELLDEVRTVPGIQVAATSNLPFQSPDWAPSIQLPQDPATARRPAGAGYVVTPGYFRLLGTPLLEGRAFTETDGPSGIGVAIANRAFEREFFEGRGAVGRQIRIWGDDGGLSDLEIVGVVGNTVQERVEDGDRPALYFPYRQADWQSVQVVVRSERDATAFASELRAAAHRFNPILPAPDIERVTDRIRLARTEPRFQATLFVSFACIAVLLAAVGLYGTLEHAVGRRTREMGIRMAVGADRRTIRAMVLREGMRVFAVGLAVGLAAAAMLTRLLGGLLFGVGPIDVPAFAATAALLTAVAAIAVYRPARRATRVDPMQSLRAD
jgi:putative ABC transport system permease protein